MKKILFFIFILSFPLSLFAKEKYTFESTENVLKLSGGCSIDITLVLTALDDTKKSLYSSGTACKNGTFLFSDDLSQWNIPDGQYTLWVNGEPAEKRITMKKIVVQENPALQKISVKPKNTFEQGVSDFGKNLAEMSHSLGVIEENLPEMDYKKDTVKRTLIGFLRTTLDTLASFFGDFTSESSEVRPSEMETISTDTTPVPENVSDTVPVPNAPVPDVVIPDNTDEGLTPAPDEKTALTDIPTAENVELEKKSTEESSVLPGTPEKKISNEGNTL